RVHDTAGGRVDNEHDCIVELEHVAVPFLALPERLLRTFTSGNVPGYGRCPLDRPLPVFYRRDCQGHINNPAIFCPALCFHVADQLTAPDPFQDPRGFVTFPRRYQEGDRFTGCFFSSITIEMFSACIP